MLPIAADLRIKSRWILSVESNVGLLEYHSLLIRDGRIVDLLPDAEASEKYVSRVLVDRPWHLTLPGLINADTQLMPVSDATSTPDFLADSARARVADLLRSGITSFCAHGRFPEETARIAIEQGMRAVIALPVAGRRSRWAESAADDLTQALRLHDQYRDHATIRTRFAPQNAVDLSDADLGRIGTLADELDAGISMAIHESTQEIHTSLSRHGMRPLERLQALGLLTPAFTAIRAAQWSDTDLEQAVRSGIAVTASPSADQRRGAGCEALLRLIVAGLRLSLGSGAGPADFWSEIKLLTLSSPSCAAAALTVASAGGAAALGIDGETGTLAIGKWADICSLDLRVPAMQPIEAPATQVATRGGRDLVSDVWVAGRQLLNHGEFTRLEWPAVLARLQTSSARQTTGDS